MAISAAEVQKLREKTGAGMMDCKRALEEALGDLEKAIQLLREKGKATAQQKSARVASCGVVCSWISQDLKRGSLIELNCETDFVARTHEFLDFSKTLARIVAEESVSSPEELATKIMAETNESVESAIKEMIAKLGENIVVRKTAYLGQEISLGSSSLVVGAYIHAPMESHQECGSIGVLVGMERDSAATESNSLLGYVIPLRELAMQIAAASPKWVKKEEVPSALKEKEIEIYKEQCRQSGKPEKAWEKIIQGKLADFYKQFCLLEQSYIRDPRITVQSYLQNVAGKEQKLPAIVGFYRFKVAEE